MRLAALSLLLLLLLLLGGCGSHAVVHGTYDQVWAATMAATRAQASRAHAEEGSGATIVFLGKAEARNHYDKQQGKVRVVLPTASPFTLSVGAVDATITPIGSELPIEHRVHVRAWQKSAFFGLGASSIKSIEQRVLQDLSASLELTRP